MAPAALGFITLFFGIGQAAGPSVAGIIADRTESFAPAFMLAAFRLLAMSSGETEIVSDLAAQSLKGVRKLDEYAIPR